MRREHIEDLIAKEVEQIIEGTDLELVDVEYVRERNWYLRVFIDKEGGVDLDWTASSRRTRTSSAMLAGP